MDNPALYPAERLCEPREAYRFLYSEGKNTDSCKSRAIAPGKSLSVPPV
jgi:hypothetical protein